MRLFKKNIHTQNTQTQHNTAVAEKAIKLVISQYIHVCNHQGCRSWFKNRYFITFILKISEKLYIKLGFCDIAILVVHGELFTSMNYIFFTYLCLLRCCIQKRMMK